jgi:hypothetical protein
VRHAIFHNDGSTTLFLGGEVIRGTEPAANDDVSTESLNETVDVARGESATLLEDAWLDAGWEAGGGDEPTTSWAGVEQDRIAARACSNDAWSASVEEPSGTVCRCQSVMK